MSAEEDGPARPSEDRAVATEMAEQPAAPVLLPILGREHLAITQRIALSGSSEIDLDSHIALWTDELWRLVGRAPARFGPTLDEFISWVHEADRARVDEAILRDVAGETVGPLEFRLDRPDGFTVWLLRHSELHIDPILGHKKLVEVFQNVTERKRLEADLLARDEALRQGKDHLELAQHIAHVGSIERDLRTGRITVSDEVYHLLDLEPGAAPMTMETMARHIHPDDLDLVAELNRQAWDGREVPPVDYRIMRPNGEIRWIRREAAITRDADGVPVLSASTLLDITPRKRMEAELLAATERLRRSEAHLHRAQHAGLIGSSEVDLIAGSHHWTDQYYRLLGFEPHSVPATRETFFKAIIPEDHHKLHGFADLMAVEGPIPAVELRTRRADGSVRWLERQMEVLRDRAGRATYIVFTLQDITERKRMEFAMLASVEEARRNREHMARAQRVGRIGSSELDIATGIQTWSDEFYRLLGLEPGALQPSRAAFLGFVLPEDRARLSNLGDIIASTGPLPPADVRVQIGIDEIRWVRRRVEVIRENGRAARLMFTLEDITERKRMETALIDSADEVRRSREHLARAQRIGRVGSVELSFQGGPTIWSDEVFEMTGLPAATKPSLEAYLTAVHPDDRDRVRASGLAMIHGRPVDASAYRIVRPDGEVRWLYRAADNLYDANGVPYAAIAVITDITELRRSEEEKAKLQEHLAHVQKLDSLGALSGGIAHDFNNLLTSMLGNAALLRDDEALPEEARKLARAVVRAAEQGAELTRRLLSFGRRQMLSPVALDLGLVARDLDLLLRHTLGEHIDFAIRTASDLWRVTADKNQLETAIINLAVNARDAMPDGGALTIDIANASFDDAFVAAHAGAKAGDYVAISVMDSGIGMSPEVLARAFEPFFTTKPEGRGTGLGLAMVYGFVKQSGGYTEIQSEPGVGTRVVLYLPRDLSMADQGRPNNVQNPSRGGTESILLVEDNRQVREFFDVVLRRLGYRVTAAADAHAALEALNNGDAAFDLLLTDLMLPGGMNGRELAGEAARLRPGLRVLFASGYTEDALIQRGQLEPGQLLLPKPFEAKELAAKIRQALER